ncbi:MAG: aldo/keto reductase [Burkholderiaceae bacterium]|nr:MAG: aldo/keto reductase [Burkholderiaceae bacterium]
MKLALGTVQFGLPYGVANQTGQVSRTEAEAILRDALIAGFDTLDTAIAYGESEQRLGEIGVGRWQVVSKLPAIPEACTDVAAWAQKSVMDSLMRLKIPKLHGLLLHCSQQLLGKQGEVLYGALLALKEQGAVEKIGVSIYDPQELDALGSRFRCDLVQAPFNILDRRLASSGWLARLHQSGTEVHVRSIFLQGLLLMEATKRPAMFNRWQPLWDHWHRWLSEQALTPLQACLGFAMSQPEIDRVVVGIDSLKQLQEIMSAVETKIAPVPQSLVTEDVQLLNPSNWQTQ